MTVWSESSTCSSKLAVVTCTALFMNSPGVICTTKGNPPTRPEIPLAPAPPPLGGQTSPPARFPQGRADQAGRLVAEDLDHDRLRPIPGHPDAQVVVGGVEDVRPVLRRVHEHGVDPGHGGIGRPGDVLSGRGVADPPRAK